MRHLLLSIMLLVPMLSLTAADTSVAEAFGRIPIQHEGRVKPIDTFARTYLLAVYGKRKTSDQSATAWLLELMVDPETSFDRPVFHIRNPEVVDALNLEARRKRYYSFNEISTAIQPQRTKLNELYRKDPKQRTLVEKQLVELYVALLRTMELSSALSGLTPMVAVTNQELAKKFDLMPMQDTNYRHFLERAEVFREALTRIENQQTKDQSAADQELVSLAMRLNTMMRAAGNSETFRVIPPETNEEWHSPWQMLTGQKHSEGNSQLLNRWESLIAAYRADDQAGARDSADQLATLTADLAGISSNQMSKETGYNQAAWFTRSLAFYMMGFLLLGCGLLGLRTWLHRAATTVVWLGLACHAWGLFLRMQILGRPPVSNLYESVIFVGFIAVLTGVCLELSRRDGIGLFFAAVPGAILHFVGFGYAAEGDTLGMLVAVLNSNFWLATHVVTITIGYGCALVAGVAGHLYLMAQIANPAKRQRLTALGKNLLGLTLVGLFFSLLGTILGGIWADQSWGRFWGWDPKENGALLICMWLLFLIHGRLANQFRMTGFAVGLVLSNIVVALAWFGVNLLNVGLHSYGFTDSIAMNLAMFCGAELLFAAICGPLATWRANTVRRRTSQTVPTATAQPT